MSLYALGVDFGTLSGRTVLVDLATGEERSSAVYEYPHGVMDTALPDGTPLGDDWALEHPRDWIGVLQVTIPAVLEQAGARADEVVGIGTDFTACTLLPVKADGTPLCFLPTYMNRPHAYPKLWKHHAAQRYANRLNAVAEERGEPWLANYGGKISSEWAVPKMWQVLEEDEAVYNAADRFIEAADWIVWQLCGKETRNACTAGYKEIWNKRMGFPSDDFFAALDPRLAHVVDEKLSRDILPLGATAGELTAEAASLTGRRPGIPVAVGNVDAHVCIPAVGIDRPGALLAIMGTSTCHISVGETEVQVPGIGGVVEDGVLPGFFGYEAGQACVGDHFAWFIDRCVPASYTEQARAAGRNIHAFLREKAQAKKPGESGLLALDWWNGNRSVLVDADLSGMLLGMTLQTKPEDIYRALIEATAYGTRMIVENYRENGVPVEAFYASGGISQKDPMTMQIYADVLNMPVKIAGAEHGPAYGAALFGAVAGGAFADIFEAARRLGKVKDTVYIPDPADAAAYDRLFAEYRLLHDYFGRGGNDVMKRLKAMKQNKEAAV